MCACTRVFARTMKIACMRMYLYACMHACVCVHDGDRVPALVRVGVDVLRVRTRSRSRAACRPPLALPPRPAQVVIATPGGTVPELRCENDEITRWVRDHKRLFVTARALDAAIGARRRAAARAAVAVSLRRAALKVCAVCIPNAPGALVDLRANEHVRALLRACRANSGALVLFVLRARPCGCVCVLTHARAVPVCTIGYSTGALLVERDGDAWAFAGKCMTGASTAESAATPLFAKLPIVVADELLEAGAQLTVSTTSAQHVVVDGTLVTAQGTEGSALAALVTATLVRAGGGRTATV